MPSGFDFNENDGYIENDFDDSNADCFLSDTPHIPNSVLGIKTKEPFPMLKKTTKKPKTIKNATVTDNRPKLIHCGNHLIDLNDVVCITKVQKHQGLYIVKLRSNPNPEFPIWVNEADITPLIQQFNIVTGE
jgi:hypothetical protein